jgi:hypothetical protein
MAPQTLVIENSAEPKRSVCRGPTSMSRVYLPQSLLAETYEHAKFCELDSQLGECLSRIEKSQFLTDRNVTVRWGGGELDGNNSLN